jgi:hypothetical protein
MRKLLAVIAVLFVLSPYPVVAGAAPEGKTLVVKGTLVDVNCYLKGGFTTDDHDGMLRCGRDCLQQGLPAGLLVDKKLYLLVFPGKVFADYVGKTLEVSGTLYDGSLLLPGKADVVGKDGKKSIKLKGKVMM